MDSKEEEEIYSIYGLHNLVGTRSNENKQAGGERESMSPPHHHQGNSGSTGRHEWDDLATLQKITNGPKMKISSLAQKKLIAAARVSEKIRAGGTEVRGGLLCDLKDPLYVKDIFIMGCYSASGGYVASSGADEIEEYKRWIKEMGKEKADERYEMLKGDWHKHPGGGDASPSTTDTTCVETRMKDNLDCDAYPFIVTNNEGRISAFVGLRLDYGNSVIKFEPQIRLYRLETEIVFDEDADQKEYQEGLEEVEADLLKLEESFKKEDEEQDKKLKEEEERLKKDAEEKTKKLREKLFELRAKHTENKLRLEKEKDEIIKLLKGAVMPSKELIEETIEEMEKKLPGSTVVEGLDFFKGAAHRPKGMTKNQWKEQKRLAERMKDGARQTLAEKVLNPAKDGPKTARKLDNGNILVMARKPNTSTWYELEICNKCKGSIPKTGTGTCVCDKEDNGRSSNESKEWTDREMNYAANLTDTELEALAENYCPETKYRLDSSECHNCAFYDRTKRDCMIGFLIPKKLLEEEFLSRTTGKEKKGDDNGNDANPSNGSSPGGRPDSVSKGIADGAGEHDNEYAYG